MTVDTVSGEGVARPTYSEVRDSVATARGAGAKFFEQIVWQVEHRAWEVLGYADWDAMREAEYADMGVAVPRADRPEIVTRMRLAGLTQREVADTIGVSIDTVKRDSKGADAPFADVTVGTSRGPRPASYATRTAEPEVAAGLAEFVNADASVRSARWQRNFMASIAKSGQIILYDPADIAANADLDLIAEYERLIRDLSNHLERVRGELPSRLTAIQGGRK